MTLQVSHCVQSRKIQTRSPGGINERGTLKEWLVLRDEMRIGGAKKRVGVDWKGETRHSISQYRWFKCFKMVQMDRKLNLEGAARLVDPCQSSLLPVTRTLVSAQKGLPPPTLLFLFTLRYLNAF